MAEYQEPILITGCARSGTSIIAGIIHYCGAWGGGMTGPNPNNKKGQFENKIIRDAITKPALRAAGLDPLGQKPLADPATWIIDPGWRGRVVDSIKREGYPGGPWMYKGAKMCQFWTQWHNAFPMAKWIIVRRDDADIINSCLKTGFMRAYRNEAGWQKWVNVHLQRFQEMKDAGLDVIEVWPTKVVNGQYGEMKLAVAHVGLEWNRDVIHDFVTPRLWSKKKGVPDGENNGG
jgi:hypothetical protein